MSKMRQNIQGLLCQGHWPPVETYFPGIYWLCFWSGFYASGIIIPVAGLTFVEFVFCSLVSVSSLVLGRMQWSCAACRKTFGDLDRYTTGSFWQNVSGY